MKITRVDAWPVDGIKYGRSMERFHRIAPHKPNGPVSTIPSADVCASIPNFFRQAFMVQDVAWRDTVLDLPLPVGDGFYR